MAGGAATGIGAKALTGQASDGFIMPLVDLLNVPKTDDDWQNFFFQNRDSHDRIRKAIQSQTSPAVNLTDYVVYPVSQDQIEQFLDNNQSLHSDMNGVLGLQSSDLQDVSFSDENAKIAWFYSHYLEHQSAEIELGI